MRRKISALLLSGISAFALSGCIKLDMDMKVRPDTKVDGTMVVAFSEQTMKMFESMGAGMTDKNSKTPTTKQKSFEEQTKDGVKEAQAKLPKGSTVKLYKKGGWIGQEIKFSGVDAAVALNAGTSAGSGAGAAGANKLTIVKKGDSLELNGMLDMAGGDSGSSSSGASGMGDMSAMMGSTKPELKVKFTFPGKVTSASTGGKISGNSVTWTPEFGKKLIMKAVAKAN